jgi:hypothetical protein
MEEAMAEFRYEYVTGVFPLVLASPEYERSITFFFTNRGHTPEAARVILLKGNETMLDTGDRTVDPGGLDGYGFGDENPDEVRPLFWARIFTTSVNVVPSVLVDAVETGQSPQRAVWQAYISPRDFAVFELPYRPFHPPETAAAAVRKSTRRMSAAVGRLGVPLEMVKAARRAESARGRKS